MKLLNSIKSVILMTTVFLYAAFSHGHGSTEAEHGGKIQAKHDLVFELVRKTGEINLYVKDHGKDHSTSDLTGSILVLSSGKKQEVELVPAGGNKMTAEVSIPDGAKVLIKIKESDHHPITVRFSY